MATTYINEDLYEEKLPDQLTEITVRKAMYRPLSCPALPAPPLSLPVRSWLHDKETQDNTKGQRWSNCTPPSPPSDTPGAAGETTLGAVKKTPPVAVKKWKVQRRPDGSSMFVKTYINEDVGSPLYEEKLPDQLTETYINEDLGSPLYEEIVSAQLTEVDPDFLKSWWQDVLSWDDLEDPPKGPKTDEAKMFTLKACRIQNALQLYDLLLNERGETLKNHITELNCISENLDKFWKGTKIAGIAGGATTAVALGGAAAIVGVALAPVTFGTSLVLTAVGVGMGVGVGAATAGGAAIAHRMNITQDRKKIEEILQDYKSQVQDIEACLQFINKGMESLGKHNLATLTGVDSRAVRVAKVVEVAGDSGARAKEASSKTSGMLSGFAVDMDTYFSDSVGQKLKNGLKSKFGKKIHQLAQELNDGLDELMRLKGLFEKSLEEV